jgi:hypothetical protein
MTAADIQATGILLETYHSDLVYIRNFQRYKQGQFSADKFVEKSAGTFYQFLIEFRVTRNFQAGKSDSILHLTTEWINGSTPNDVDGFAHLLNKKKLTHDKIMTSLGSKILFLNSPWTILPMDSLARKALGQNDNLYSTYLTNLDIFKKSNSNTIKNNIEIIEPFLTKIESEFNKEIEDIKTIRQNRFVDKLLWTLGQVKQKK